MLPQIIGGASRLAVVLFVAWFAADSAIVRVLAVIAGSVIGGDFVARLTLQALETKVRDRSRQASDELKRLQGIGYL